MFENFFHQIDKELGPLNPDWFEELTAKASRDEGHPDRSKAEQEEDTVKAPETSALGSQLFSTPKIFKQQHFQSPDSVPNEESPYEVTNGDSSAFPWAETSPCLFGSAKDCQRFDRSCEKPKECIGLLDTPKRSLPRSAKRISESLGAQINPDLSWTSSFNTPSSLTPTVILPKTEDCCPSSSVLKDKEAIFVRKLFPSLSKVSAITADDTTLKQDVIAKSETINADDLGENPACSPNASVDSSGLWKQKVPSAIEDGDVRTTVQNVLDGAEDVLSIFFSNNTSTLRRIKTNERIRRRITDSSKDVRSLVLTSEPEEILKADVETKSPSKNKDIIQWTPLSLSESILNGSCLGASLINNHNTVASSETNGGTVFNCTAESSQTFSQSVRLRSYPEEAEHQKTLLDKSPAFMLTRKPRKFVYQVPSSDLSKTVIGHKATLPVCLDQTVKESSSVEKVSSDLNESRFASEYAINSQTQPQDIELLSTEPHVFDHGLDMTQLSKAFAEDFTQEIRPKGLLDVPVKNDQNGQVQPKAELEENKFGNHNDISDLADISVNSPNKSTVMLTPFDISHDSGCPTTFSDLDGTTASSADIKEFCPTFKTANNKAISIPSEAIMRAKASLAEAAGDGLSITLNQTTPKHYQKIETLCKSVSGSTNATRSPVGQFIFPNHASITFVSDAPKSDSPKSFKINISSYSSPQSNESDYKTGSKRNITASDVGLQTETLLKEELRRDSSKCIHQKPDFEKSAERQTVFDINSIHKPTAVDSSCDDIEKNGTLTASQKADVTELCSLLEEANSQHEFTQFKPTNLCSDNNTTERDWDADIVNDIDFDDSFNCDFVKGKHPVKTDASSVNSSDHIQIVDAAKLCTMSKETQNGIVPLTEDTSLVDGMKNVLSNFTRSDNTQFQSFGFKTAEGKSISISEKSLNKARHFFEEDDQEVKVDIGMIKSELSDSISTESKAHNVKDVHFSSVYGNAACKEINKQVAGNAEMEQNCLGEKPKAVSWSETSIKINQPDPVVVDQISDGPNIPSFDSENVFQELKSSNDAKEVCAKIFPSETSVPLSGQGYGFQTASGKGVSVSASALKKAKDIFKDCDSNIDIRESTNMEGKNDKLVEIIEQTNASISNCKSVTFSDVVEAKTVFRDTDLINDFSLQSSLGQTPPQEKVFEQKGFQNEFSKYVSELLPLNGNCGFSTASGKKVSISAGAIQRAKDVFSESVDGFSCANDSQKTKQVVDNQTDSNSSGEHKGLCTTGGKKVPVSATGLQREKYLFRDCKEDKLSSKDLQHQNSKGFSDVSEKTFAGCSNIPFSHEPETGNSLGKNVGFSTAGGKKVAISATALQRAKSLFNDCEEENLSSGSLQHQGCKGFSTASGKDVTVSENALSEVRAAFAGCDDASVSHKPTNSSGDNAGFSTAGGKKVAISATAIQRAKSLFKGCEEENVASKELVSEKVPPHTKSSHRKSEDIVDGNLKFEKLNKKNCGFSTASGKGVSVSKVALEEASKLFRDCDAQVTATDNQLLQSDFSKRCTQNKEKQTKTTIHSLPSKVTQNVPAQLDLHSLDFNRCTDTQQKYFEQEAMACTEALLADDDLNESAKLVMSEGTDYKKSSSIHNVQTQGSFDQNRRRKRQFDSSSVADSGQPPFKRQLLSEFDQTLDAKSSGLTPLKSCPNGTLKDRRVFRYNVHLKPNVTAPDWHHVGEKSNDLEQHCSTVSVQNRRNSGTKGVVFVPPFQKVLMAGTSNCQNTVSKVSSSFISPFKKENKEQTDHCNQMDQKMTTSTSHNDSVVQYCDEKNLQEGFKPKSTISVESVVNMMDSEEKDTKAWQETLNLARDMQDMRLRKKKRQTIRPLPGSLYLAKASGVPRISLRNAVGCKCPGHYTQEELYQHGVHREVSKITSENAESFRFDCNDFFKRELLIESGALQLADGGWLVPDSKGTVGKDEFYSALCDTPGVDPKLISDAWVFNHYRWIVWKRASMERTFPVLMGSLCLTPEQVLLQLKFRYDVEVDHSQRSALRRIMERDDTPAKTLVLCVCGVAKTCQNPEKLVKDEKTPNAKMESCVIWLTDGWYSIKGLLDLPLSAMLNKGRLRIGDKIVTSGAELVGSQEACSPLEAPESLMLKISANSTRRARWDTKLGYYRDPRPIRLPLSSLYTTGGVVSCVNIVVLRSYPTQWMEKKPNGVFIFRNDRAEDREARKHSTSKHKSMDLLISKIQTQFEKEMEGKTKSHCHRRTFSRHEIEALQDGEDLYEAMERDPAVETHLSERQMEAVSKYRRCLGERSQAELQERVQKAVTEAQEAEGGCPNRDVTPVWKLSITDASDLQKDRVYTLNIWRPSRDLYGLLREGHRYRAYHLATSEGKKRSGIAHIQFTATKKTLFRDIEVSPEWLHQHFVARECVRFRELQNPQFSSPCGEVDIVGYIVSIVGKQGNCPVLHLVDENFDLVSVRTYSSLEHLAIEELVKPRALIALSNLQVRPLSGPVPSLYAGEQALFSVNPKESHLQEAMAHLKTFVQTCEQFYSIAEEKVSDVVPSGVLGCFQSPRTPGVQSNPKINGRVTPQQNSSSFSPFTPLNRRTPVSANNTEGKDPKNLKRRRGLDYLSRIPSPPPLTPLKTRASPCVNKTFNPPRRSVTPKPPQNEPPGASRPPTAEETWVNDEELVMIDTQALLDGLREG
ncbi:breast cancer type 2 susceptibility protein [Chanodichthys erythropterus]|uniref:breast cancer type 2 susceptibility protein n=1 Tax=Chanodichthys erythropterus TaxID=933992 RepID=UPI00351F1850